MTEKSKPYTLGYNADGRLYFDGPCPNRGSFFSYYGGYAYKQYTFDPADLEKIECVATLLNLAFEAGKQERSKEIRNLIG